MADKDNMSWIDAEFIYVLRLAQKVDADLCIFEGVPERERAAAAPCPTIEGDQHVPSRPPDGVSEIKVLFIAGKTMQHQRRRMRAGAGCNVNDRIHLSPMARNVRPGHRRRIEGVKRRV